jgi:hypothetical protein
MTAVVDIDAQNVAIDVAFFEAKSVVFDLTSTQLRGEMLRQRRRSPSTLYALENVVQLTVKPATFIAQREHQRVAKALNELGVVVETTSYVPFDAETKEGETRTQAFGVSVVHVDGKRLTAALVAAGVKSVRCVEFHAQLPIATWCATYAAFVLDDCGKSVIDVSTTSVPQPQCVPLVRAEKGRTTSGWPLLLSAGAGYGSLFLKSVAVGPGLKCEAVCVYPGGLVHRLKALGLGRLWVNADLKVQAARAMRLAIVAAAGRFFPMGCESSDPRPPFSGFDTLRIEGTFVINHNVRREREQWEHLLSFLSIDDIKQLETMYSVKGLRIAQRPVPWLVYQRSVFESLRRLTADEQFSIGVGRNDRVSLPSVPVRLVDVLNAFGIFCGWHWVNLVNKQATWASWSPTVDDIWQSKVVGAGDILDEVSVEAARAQRDVFLADERQRADEERDRIRDMLIQRDAQPASIRQARQVTAAAAEAVAIAAQNSATRKRRRADLLQRLALAGTSAGAGAVQRRDDSLQQLSRLRRLMFAPTVTVPDVVAQPTLSAAQILVLTDVQTRLIVCRHRHGWCARHPFGQVLLVRKTVAELHTAVAFAGHDWTTKFASTRKSK